MLFNIPFNIYLSLFLRILIVIINNIIKVLVRGLLFIFQLKHTFTDGQFSITIKKMFPPYPEL